MWRRFPEHPPYGGAHPDPIPHLTVDTAETGELADLCRAATEVGAQLPVRAWIDRVNLIAGTNAPRSWRTLAEFELRSPGVHSREQDPHKPLVVALGSAVVLLIGSVAGVFAYLAILGRGWVLVSVGFGVALLGAAAGWIWVAFQLLDTRRKAALGCAVVAALPAAFIFGSMLVAPGIHGPVRFWLLWPLFDHAAQFARSADLPVEQGDFRDVRQLPPQLCVLGRGCDVLKFGSSHGGPPVVYVPYEPTTQLWGPDAPSGYGYFAEPPDPAIPYGTWSQAWVCPTVELGGGWWWMERPSSHCADQ